jgi:hypothetical protein
MNFSSHQRKCLIQEEIKRRVNSGNACYHSVQNLLSSRLISKKQKQKIRIYKTIILPIVLYGCETWYLLRTARWEYLDRRELKWQEAGENCIMRSFITCTLLQV